MVIIEVVVKVEEVTMVVVVNFLVVTMVNFLVVANFTTAVVNLMVMVNFHLHHSPRIILPFHKNRELLVRFVVRMATLLWIVMTI